MTEMDLRPTPPAIEHDDFRRVLSHFCSGIAVITGMHGGFPVGLTCQAFSSLSLDPPLVSFSPGRRSGTWPRIQAAGRFAANILGADQEWISRAFAASGTDKFAGVDWTLGEHGTPLITGALANIECDVEAVHDGGDHHIVVGRVRTLIEHPVPGAPLLYFRSEYRTLP
jgi:3-hydroxy-9,10-secoandrosta-1,3,5(10)-triene-9,17-dione monooxygenase reductase component